MKLFAWTIYFFLSGVFVSAQPSLIILRGNGSVGKTSIGKAIQKQGIGWVTIDEDDVYVHVWLGRLKREFPSHFAAIEATIHPNNIFHAISRNEIIFNESSDEQGQFTTLSAINVLRQYLVHAKENGFERYVHTKLYTTVLHKIHENLSHGRSVVLDCTFSSVTKIRTAFARYPITKALVFCSLDTCCKNLQKRNAHAFESKNLQQKRFYKHVIPSFIDFYRLTHNSQKAVDRSSKKEIIHIFDAIDAELAKETNAQVGMVKELTRTDLQALRNRLLTPNLRNGDLYIEPRDVYDIIINTDRRSPEINAERLLKFMQVRASARRLPEIA